MTNRDYLRKLCHDGLIERYGQNPAQHLIDRLEYELGTIESMGYVEYFLTVWVLQFTRSKTRSWSERGAARQGGFDRRLLSGDHGHRPDQIQSDL